MTQSWTTIPHIHGHDELDAQPLVDAVRGLRAPRRRVAARVLTLSVFFVLAAARALRRFPLVNASIDLDAHEIVVHEEVNVGLAVATPAGLIVPVVRSADRRSLFDLAAEIDRLARAARERKVKPDELRSGTFTVTNFGSLGGRFANPIIRPPEVGILGFGAIRERPWAMGGGRIEVASGAADLVRRRSPDHRRRSLGRVPGARARAAVGPGSPPAGGVGEQLACSPAELMVVGEVASSTEILVIGGGPGGYAAALRARGHGKQVTLVEAERIGGVCLNVGCIPSKALIHAAEIAGMREEAAAAGVDLEIRADMRRIQARMQDAVERLTGGVEKLLDGAGVERVKGRARFTRENRVAVVDGDHIAHIEFEQAIVATGSRPAGARRAPVRRQARARLDRRAGARARPGDASRSSAAATSASSSAPRSRSSAPRSPSSKRSIDCCR